MSAIVCIPLAPVVLRLPPKVVLVGGHLLAGLFTILFVYGDTRSRFWGFTFVAEIFVTAGASAAYLVAKCVSFRGSLLLTMD